MAFIKTNTFCFKFLSEVSGIEPKTIDVMIDNGFDSIHSLVAIKVDTDLNQIQDLLLGQKAILREALQELQKKYKLMRIDSNKDNTYTRLLEECLMDTTNNYPQKSPIKVLNSSTNGTENKSTSWKTSTPKKLTKTIESNEMIKTVDRRQSDINGQPLTTIAEKFGLRSATKLKPKKVSDVKRSDDINRRDDSFPQSSLEPEVIVETLSDESKNCSVCDRREYRRYANGSLCDLCLRFYRKNKERVEKFFCNNDNNCLIEKNSNKNCRRCRWNRCHEVFDGSNLNNSCGEPSLKNLSLNLNTNSDQLNDQSFDEFMENTEYVTQSQPNINLTPIKLKLKNKSKAPNSRTKNKKFCSVCGGVAKSVNYGVMSCSGCAIFFRRVQLNIRQTGKCVGSDNCEITQQTRNNCRSCRYKACVRVGMTSNDIIDGNKTNDGFLEDDEEMEQQEEDNANQVQEEEELRDNHSDVSATTGYDYASILCGRSPETPKLLNKTKRKKY